MEILYLAGVLMEHCHELTQRRIFLISLPYYLPIYLMLCWKMPYHQQSITNSQKSAVLLSLYIHNDILMFSQMGNGNFCALNHIGGYTTSMLLPSTYLGTSTTNKHSVNLPFKCLMEKRTNCVFKVTHRSEKSIRNRWTRW